MKDFEVIRLQPGQSVQAEASAGQLKPVRLWIFPHGATDNTPSYAWELVDIFGHTYFAQITDNMLKDAIIAAGELRVLSQQ